MKKIFVICPTYRCTSDIISSYFRMFGVVSLVQQMHNQTGNYDIKLCIVDSSADIHPFFKKYDCNSINTENILYFHIPSRNSISDCILHKYKTSIKNFIPSDSDIFKHTWQTIIKKAIAWDNIFPWDKDYPLKSTIKKQIYDTKPTIGMKRNFAISALTEAFGEADYVIYADDDDFRSSSYIGDLVNGIKCYDFGRFFNYYVWSIVNNFNIFGINDIVFFKDVNDNWLLSGKMSNGRLFNTTKHYKNTIENKYSKLIGMSFPFIAFEGATHIFKYSIWKQMLKYTNGIPITSICEDILFFKECKKYLGLSFKETQIKLKKMNFLRVNNGFNASVIEWTKNIEYTDLPKWICEIINNYNIVLNIKNIESYYYNLYNSFVKDGMIKF